MNTFIYFLLYGLLYIFIYKVVGQPAADGLFLVSIAVGLTEISGKYIKPHYE